MSYVNRVIASAILMSMSLGVFAQPNLLTTIKPIGLIAKDIAGDLAKVDVLLPDHASPHSFSLTPSDLKALKTSDVVIWVGPEMESFLTKYIQNIPNQMQLTALANMKLRHYDADNHEHDHGHVHSDIDGHIWLGVEQSLVIADAIKSKLILLDPKNSEQYQNNFEQFKKILSKQKQVIIDRLKDKKIKGYFLFHDAYGYFEETFGLKASGHITFNPDRKPGAKTVVRIRKELISGDIQCVFSEPQFNPAMVDTLVYGTSVKVVLLDPMGKELTLDKNSYSDFIQQLGDSFNACFR